MDDILIFTVSTPFDVKNKFSDMVRGSIKQGQYHPYQMGYNRPNPECSQHHSPIKGLYMGGACTYPGGTILLGSGFLAADAVCEDLGIKKWWGVPECVAKARAKGSTKYCLNKGLKLLECRRSIKESSIKRKRDFVN